MIKGKLFVIVLILIGSIRFCLAQYAAPETAALEQFDFATGLFERGMYKMAGDEYKKFIDAFAQSEHLKDAYFGFAESLYFQKSYDEALYEYNKYLERFSTADNQMLVVKLRIGEVFFFTERFDDAIAQLESLEREDFRKDQMQTLYYYLAKAYRRKGDDEKARPYFNKAAEIIGDNEYAFNSLIELGDLYAGMSEYDKALEQYSNAHEKSDSEKTKSFSLYKIAETQFLAGDYPASINSFKRVLSDYPENEIYSEALSNLLLSLFNTEKYEELIKEYADRRHLIKNEDKFFNVHFTAYSAYTEIGDHEKALSGLDGLLSSGWVSQKNKDRAALKKSEIFLSAKRFDEAIKEIDAHLSSEDDYADNIIFIKGEALYGAGDFEGAAAQFNKLIDEHPGSPFAIDAIYSLAYVQKNMEQNKSARDSFMKYYERSKDGTKSQAALYNAILLDLKDEELGKAVKDCKLYLSTFEHGKYREKILFTLGSVYSQIKDYGNAIHMYKEFIEVYKGGPKLQDAYFRIAYGLQMSDKYDEAVEHYDKLEKDMNIGGLYYAALKNKVLIYFAKENKSKAAEVYDHIISDFPGNDLGIEGHFWLAKYYLECSRFKDAIRILEKTGARPDAKGNEKQIAYFKAEAYKETEDFSKAIENYDIVFSYGDQGDVYSGASRIGKGLCLIETGEYDKAKEEFDKAILENPDDDTIVMRAKFEIAGIEQLKGNMEQAYKLYMMVAILYDNDEYSPRSLLKAADIFQDLKKFAEAKKAYREIIDKYGETEFARDARNRLQGIRWKLND
ncbi:MAG: tetratricopeptide repeat protein [Candidatus Omnitrophica bacterium]|nr:tetratricopeptide repeat protein [Candidatus Omnitrophota bacterium]